MKIHLLILVRIHLGIMEQWRIVLKPLVIVTHLIKETSTNNSDNNNIKKMTNLNEMKHPLEHEWSFWFFTNKEMNWEDNLVEMSTFNTVEDYWCLYHHMKLPSELSIGQDYAIFKSGIRPMWEDEANMRGGRWQIMFEELRGPVLDSIWLDTVLLLIGENFQQSDSVCGVVVNVRNKPKVGVWMNTTNAKPVIESGRKLRQTLNVPNKLQFFKHNTSKNMYTV